MTRKALVTTRPISEASAVFTEGVLAGFLYRWLGAWLFQPVIPGWKTIRNGDRAKVLQEVAGMVPEDQILTELTEEDILSEYGVEIGR